MSALSQESIKHLTKSELKTELTKRGLPLNGRKEDLLKRLTETLNEESNKVDETENIYKLYQLKRQKNFS